MAAGLRVFKVRLKYSYRYMQFFKTLNTLWHTNDGMSDITVFALWNVSQARKRRAV